MRDYGRTPAIGDLQVAAFLARLILCAVRWYLRYSLSYREVQELLVERGLEIDHTTVWRWVQRYAPELEERTRPHLKPTHKSWRVDETYVRVKGRWFYLYRAIDSGGATIDFLLKITAPSRNGFVPSSISGNSIVRGGRFKATKRCTRFGRARFGG